MKYEIRCKYDSDSDKDIRIVCRAEYLYIPLFKRVKNSLKFNSISYAEEVITLYISEFKWLDAKLKFWIVKV